MVFEKLLTNEKAGWNGEGSDKSLRGKMREYGEEQSWSKFRIGMISKIYKWKESHG